jgi:hypothetical protein
MLFPWFQPSDLHRVSFGTSRYISLVHRALKSWKSLKLPGRRPKFRLRVSGQSSCTRQRICLNQRRGFEPEAADNSNEGHGYALAGLKSLSEELNFQTQSRRDG